jgi:hypothetical protein
MSGTLIYSINIQQNKVCIKFKVAFELAKYIFILVLMFSFAFIFSLQLCTGQNYAVNCSKRGMLQELCVYEYIRSTLENISSFL